jgi:cytochrome c peroxidase
MALATLRIDVFMSNGAAEFRLVPFEQKWTALGRYEPNRALSVATSWLRVFLLLNLRAYASIGSLREGAIQLQLSLKTLGVTSLLISLSLPASFAADSALGPGIAPAAGATVGSLPTNEARSTWRPKYVRPSTIPFPADNAYTKDRALLGKTLFFDPRLSRSHATSCASCHNPGFAWGDALPKGIGFGMKQLGRHSPTILNTAWADLLFWDGRADSLEAQALGPIASPGEMNMPLEQLIETVNNIPGYKPLFERAYPGAPIDAKTIARAIATFERTVVSAPAPFDKWVEGDRSAISGEAKRGFDVFNGKARCAQCHSGWNFTDNGFHDIGIKGDDRGRGAKLPLEAMQYAFKTPTLRNADLRAPYMHDGSEVDLAQVIAFYDKGGDEKRPSLDSDIIPLHLSESEKHDLLAFLKTLTSPDSPVEIPLLPR